MRTTDRVVMGAHLRASGVNLGVNWRTELGWRTVQLDLLVLVLDLSWPVR